MYPAIILFFALLFSSFFIYKACIDIKLDLTDVYYRFTILMLIIACGFWAWFYYLTH